MALLIYLMRMVKALLDNSSLFLEKYVSISSPMWPNVNVIIVAAVNSVVIVIFVLTVLVLLLRSRRSKTGVPTPQLHFLM